MRFRGPGIGLRMGPGIASKGQPSSSYWNPLLPLGGETPSFWVKENSRSGLTMTDSVSSPANDISILPSYLSTSGVTAYAYINDNGALDIGATDFTLCTHIKSLQNTSAARYLLGKFVAASVNGRYGIVAGITTGYLTCYIQSSTTTYTITSTINASTCGDAFILFDVNQTTKKFRLFIWTDATGYNQIGSDVTFTGTFANMDNAYRFYIGAYNATTTGNPTAPCQLNISDLRIFRRILTPTEQISLLNRESLSNPLLYLPCNNINGYDSSGNGYHFTTYGITIAQLAYSSWGSKQALEVGYTRHTKFPNLEIQIPYTHTSTPCSYVPSGYTKDADIPADTLNHNGANSYLMPVAGTIDRSDTTKCTTLAREASNPFWYNVTYKLGLHAVECTNRNIASFFTNSYKGKDFIKRNGRTITDWVHYATKKTGTDYSKAIQWTAENMNFAFGSGTYACMGIYHPYTTSKSIRLNASLAKEGPFPAIAEVNLNWPNDTPLFTHLGNANMIPLNTDKCNGTVAPIAGETNWLMVHEKYIDPDTFNGLHLWKSHNALDWTYVMQLPKAGAVTVYMESWVVENDDPADYTNIHYIGFSPDQKKIYETHPLNAQFTAWSDFVEIFNTAPYTPYNAIIWYMGGEWHMFYSAYDSGPGTHYMHHAKCTHDPFTAANDWADFQTGDWSGLGSCESFTLINSGGANWILYNWELVTGNHQRYSLSDDNCATWGTPVVIPSLDSPLQVAVYYNKLK